MNIINNFLGINTEQEGTYKSQELALAKLEDGTYASMTAPSFSNNKE